MSPAKKNTTTEILKRAPAQIELESDRAETWQAKFVGMLCEDMEHIMKTGGYTSMAELIRSACREFVMKHKSLESRMILDHMLSSGKIDAEDILDAYKKAFQTMHHPDD